MDQKQQLSSLDPKLKEAYDRVMGTATNPTPPPSPLATPAAQPPPVAQPAAAANQTPPPVPEQAVQTPTPPSMSNEPEPAQPVQPMTIETSVKDTSPAAGRTETNRVSSGFVAADQPKKGGISGVIIFLALIVFFAAYALFWTRFFNLPLPFLPQP